MTSVESEPTLPDLSRPPDSLVLGGAAPQPACSYLGFYFDRNARADFAWEAHRCWRVGAPVQVAISWQNETCLTCACASCPRVQYPTAQVPPSSVAPLGSIYPGIGHYRALLIALALLLLLAVVSAVVLSASPSSSALSLPRPSSMPMATATDVPVFSVAATPIEMGGLTSGTSVLPTPTAGLWPTSTLAPVGATPLTTQSSATRSPVSPPGAATLAQRVAGVEATVRTGQIDVVADYGDGRRVLYNSRFDLGPAGGSQNLAFKSVYEGQTGSRIAERVTIGERTWDREDNGGWLLKPALDKPREQIEPLLPRVGAIAGPVVSDSNAGTLRWYDPRRDADFFLQVDPVSGIPQQLVWKSRSTSMIVTIQYGNWNGPIEIMPPTP